MPRVQTRKKAARGKEYVCSTCHKPIEPGQEFYYWTFRYGGTRRIHKEHGYPRQSQLTQSQMGDVYAAIENVEDILGSEDFAIDDVTGAVEELQGTCDEIIEAYQQAAEHFGGQGPSAERADELQSYRDQLDDVDVSEWEEIANAENDSMKECEECSGEGRVKCEHCDGGGEVSSGVLTPILVGGKPDHIEEMISCDVCAGEGNVECGECNGSGQVERDEDERNWREAVKDHVEAIIGGAP